jgi:hypothetical protein
MRAGVAWLTVAALAAPAVLALDGCAGRTKSPAQPARSPPAAASQWPSQADHTTIRVDQVMLDARLRENDWRRRSNGASLAMRSLLTVRLPPGPCASYVSRLYGELWGLFDDYPGDDWRPLARLV